MSHIASKMSTPGVKECRYSGRAFGVWQFYKKPMGLRIRELREAKGWTQHELAEKATMSRSQLAMIENETRPANTLRLNAIANALGVTTEELFDSGNGESRIVGLMRLLAPDDRETILKLAESLARRDGKA